MKKKRVLGILCSRNCKNPSSQKAANDLNSKGFNGSSCHTLFHLNVNAYTVMSSCDVTEHKKTNIKLWFYIYTFIFLQQILWYWTVYLSKLWDNSMVINVSFEYSVVWFVNALIWINSKLKFQIWKLILITVR